MSIPREATTTISFVDQYCSVYQDLFPDVRSFEHFKSLHVGLISEIPNKSLPAISRAVGLDNGQSLHHFFANSPWSVEALRQRRGLYKICNGYRTFDGEILAMQPNVETRLIASLHGDYLSKLIPVL